MKKFLLLFPFLAFAQPYTNPVLIFNSNPAGLSCPTRRVATSTDGHFLYCNPTGNLWVDVSAGGGLSPGVVLTNPSIGSGYLSDTSVSSGAVTSGQLVCYTTLAGTVALQTCPMSASGVAGLAVSSTTGSGQTFEVASYGVVSVRMDAGGAVGGNLFNNSTTIAGRAKDLGVTASGSLDISQNYSGLLIQTCAANAQCLALEFGPNNRGSSVNLSTSTALSGQLPPTLGGVGAMTGAPLWMRYYGRGTDGANADCNTTLNVISGAEYNYTSFGVAAGHTCTLSGHNTTIIRSQGACTIAGTITWAIGNNNTTIGDSGGSGGGGGGGTLAGSASGGISWGIQQSVNPMVSAASAGSSSGGTGGAGTALSVQQQQIVLSTANVIRGASGAGAGGSSGGAGGAGAPGLILVCPSINFTGLINYNGGDGVSSAANTTGAGGGGGGGPVVLSATTYTANTGEIAVSGGKGGGCTNPAVIFGLPSTPISGTLSGSGAVAHASTYVGGNPTVITVDNAGSGYNYTPTATLVGTGGGANTGSGATLAVTMTGVSPNMTVSSIAVSGGNAGYGTGTTYTTCGRGGDGGFAWSMALTPQ